MDKYLEQLHREGLEQGLEQGREEGRDEGFAQAVLAAYRVRFGKPPAELAAAVELARGKAELERWLEIVTMRNADEVLAALPRTRKSIRGSGRQNAAPRRTSATR